MIIPNNTKIELITYEPVVLNILCRIGTAPFKAEFSITYMPGDVLLEFIEFELWLGKLRTKATTIEEATDKVYCKLIEALRPKGLMVQCRATTRVHAPVTVTRGAFSLGGEQ